VGTHALLEKDVEFKKLGLVIIDEQHRFGVLQRLGMVQKGVTPPIFVVPYKLPEWSKTSSL
jgi:ATP-dependent DNA helicase RecG